MRIASPLLLLALVLLGGCASSLPPARVDDRLSRLVGKPVESALAAYGTPSCGSVEGNRRYMTWLYRWEPKAGTVEPPAREHPLQAQHALVSYGRGASGWVGAANAFDCRMSLEVDDQGRVQDYFYDGEACARRL